jgi:hypothetical protein
MEINNLISVLTSCYVSPLSPWYNRSSGCWWGKLPPDMECKVEVKLFLCLTNSALCQEGVWGSRCIDPHFFDLDTSWR